MSVSQLGTVNGTIVSMLTVSTGRMFRHSHQQQYFLYNVKCTYVEMCLQHSDLCHLGEGGRWPDLWKMVPNGVSLLYSSPQYRGQPRVWFTDQVITAFSIVIYFEHSEHNTPGMLDVTIVACWMLLLFWAPEIENPRILFIDWIITNLDTNKQLDHFELCEYLPVVLCSEQL